MGMVGLFVASIVNIFLGSAPFGWIDRPRSASSSSRSSPRTTSRRSRTATRGALGSVEKAAVLGAIHLYIDFVNIFLFLLRLTGGRR